MAAGEWQQAVGVRVAMDDQVKDEAAVAETGEQPAAEAGQERYAMGVTRIDNMVHKIDAGVRKLSKEIHSLEVEEDPNRVATGIKPLDNTVYKIDAGVRRISKAIHKK